MTTIVILDPKENFLEFLDSDLCDLTETIEKGGLRTLDLTYKFKDYSQEKPLFKIGNKIWIANDNNIQDCLYVINTPVVENVYTENSFSVSVEEVLVELNYAPLFTQTELSLSGQFTLSTTNGKVEVTVDWNALNYWFGDYFNIGVVQECLNPSHNKVTVTGSLTRMALLRQIEEETENTFVTRYEKDLHTNTIHRYIDFLNPNNINSDWILGVEYEFIPTATSEGVYDSNGNLTTDNNDDVYEKDDIVNFPTVTTQTVDPTLFSFRITDGRDTVNGLEWDSTDAGFTDDDMNNVITLYKRGNQVALVTKTKSFVAVTGEANMCGTTHGGFINLASDPELEDGIIPDDSYFEVLYNNNLIYQTRINNQIGHVHSEILDFGRNLENITFERDESDTFNAISPVMSLDNSSDLTRDDLEIILSNWRSLAVNKGDVIPMIVQRVSSTAKSNYDVSSNYYNPPLHPQNDTTSTPAKYEYWVATAYWRAPFTKKAKEFYIQTDTVLPTEYTSIEKRADFKDDMSNGGTPKIGTVETTEEDKYAIYNAVAMKLKEKQYPYTKLEVDVANLQDGEFNNYDIHDKIYVKVPDSQEIVTMRVTKTSKEAHDIAKNTIELESYNAGSLKNIQNETTIQCGNSGFTYPGSKTLTARLVNLDYDSNDSNSIQYPANRLLTFVVNKDGSPTGTVYTLLTDANGYATINMDYEPGDYTIDITFSGDEEYLESTITVDINVDGTLETNTTTKTSSRSKTTTRTTSTKTVKTYYSKCGQSPDKKTIVAVARPSASNTDMANYHVTYNQLYKTVFKNRCPHCGRATLVFDGGKANKCVTSAGAHGRGYKFNVPEHEITCNHCDSDYDAVTGLEKNSGHSTRLTTVKKPVKSNTKEFGLLVNGKLVYGTKKVTVSSRNTTSSKTRTSVGTINSTVRQTALNIVGNSEGLAAAKKIAVWIAKKIQYEGKANFYQSPATTLKRRKGNCCCHTELMLQMMDAAGCTEKLTLKYVHVHNSSRNVGHVFAKIINKSDGKWRYVDGCCKSKGPWGHYVTGYGSPPGSQSSYPSKPF